MSVLTRPADADAVWLTRILRESGALRSGEVVSVRAEESGASWSLNARLVVRYAEGTEPADAPASFFLKICAGEHAVFGPSEVHYYTRDYRGYRGIEGPPLARCFHAAYREEPRAYHLLLEDLSATHRDQIGVPPSAALGQASAEALARLHAVYFGERLVEAPRAFVAESGFARYFGHVEQGLNPLLEHAGKALPDAWRARLAAVFERHPALMARRAAVPRGQTLLHGDVNPGNVLAPRSGPGPVYLIDRQPFDWSIEAFVAAADLARMMIPYWDVAVRRQLERPVLEHYHASLAALGIDIELDALLADYRLCIADCLELAVEWCVLPDDREGMRWLWEPQLERAMAAYDDHDCQELFGC